MANASTSMKPKLLIMRDSIFRMLYIEGRNVESLSLPILLQEREKDCIYRYFIITHEDE